MILATKVNAIDTSELVKKLTTTKKIKTIKEKIPDYDKYITNFVGRLKQARLTTNLKN